MSMLVMRQLRALAPRQAQAAHRKRQPDKIFNAHVPSKPRRHTGRARSRARTSMGSAPKAHQSKNRAAGPRIRGSDRANEKGRASPSPCSLRAIHQPKMAERPNARTDRQPSGSHRADHFDRQRSGLHDGLHEQGPAQVRRLQALLVFEKLRTGERR